MANQDFALLKSTLASNGSEILAEWLNLLRREGALSSGRIKDAELQTQCRTFLQRMTEALDKQKTEGGAAMASVRDFLGEVSRSRALQGFSPSETATFIFSLKQPIFTALTKRVGANTGEIIDTTWQINLFLDELGLYTMEVYQKSREEVIQRQQREIAELSTPVVKLWQGILALPLIGTLDSERTQIVMENLLEGIVAQGADIAIIDITGVPTVDTLVAQHLLKTVSAARLMGADCIISGIRPQIAQTMVHLGVELNVATKANLADAFALALQKVGLGVGAARSAPRS